MKYAIDRQEKYIVFKPEEENLNSLLAPELKSQFVIFYNEGVKNLIVDLKDVKFVDSSGLSAILTADRLFKDKGNFILTGLAHDPVKKLISISHLESVITIIPTVQESIEYVHMDELQREIGAEGDEQDENDEA